MRGLIETIPVQDVYVSGLGCIERLGGNNLRFHLYVEQETDEGVKEKVVISRIIAPASAVPEAILQMVGAVAGAVRLVPVAGEMAN